nr:WecB/TagA/CpsF family glycosyltransferase [uncultured Roseobacter sp.]
MQTRLGNGDGFSVATLNLDHVVKLRQQPRFQAAYARHTHVTADGRPVVWLLRFSGQSVELVPGSELIIPATEMAACLEAPVALLGTTNETLEKAARALVTQFPTLKIAAQIAPAMDFDPEGAVADAYIEELRTSGARVCFLALGAPKQEIFAERAFARLPHMGFLSIGAGLDFIAGTQKRAPALVRAVAAEWLWRMLGNPRRLAGRYAACIAILPGLFMTARQLRRAGRRKQP